jgi:hypothetical protein
MSVPGSGRRRRGFHLVDLGIVLAIAALAMCLVFSGYLRVRDHAGRVSCTNNFRAIGTGIGNAQSMIGAPLVGFDPKTRTTIFARIADQTDFGGIPPESNAYFLCPSRRGSSSLRHGQAPCDYGWSNDPNSLLGRTPATRLPVTPPGVDKIILLGHIGVRPEDYGGGDWDGPYTTNGPAYARTPAPLYLDKDLPDSRKWMGSPHLQGVPHLFCDGSVKTIDYDFSTANEEALTQQWQYNRDVPADRPPR